MERLRLIGKIAILFGIYAVAIWTFAAAAHAQARFALVIGNADYDVGPLTNPTADAALTASALRDAGFEVRLVVNVDQNGMKREVRAFADRVRNAGGQAVAAFYYAGHGVQVEGRNFLIPVAAKISAAPDLEYETVEAQWVLDMIGDSGAGLSIIILDACRNNPFPAVSRSASRGLARMDAPRGALLSYSTAPGDVAVDGDGVNSPFTSALANAIRTPGLKIEDAFKQVRRSVLQATDQRQLPWESTSLTGDFYFTPANAGAAPNSPPALPAPVSTAPKQGTEAFVPAEIGYADYDRRDMLRCYEPKNDVVRSYNPYSKKTCGGGGYRISDGDFHKFLSLDD